MGVGVGIEVGWDSSCIIRREYVFGLSKVVLSRRLPCASLRACVCVSACGERERERGGGRNRTLCRCRACDTTDRVTQRDPLCDIQNMVHTVTQRASFNWQDGSPAPQVTLEL